MSEQEKITQEVKEDPLKNLTDMANAIMQQHNKPLSQAVAILYGAAITHAQMGHLTASQLESFIGGFVIAYEQL